MSERKVDRLLKGRRGAAPATRLVTAPGMRVQGNLDMSNRPAVVNPDGRVSSIRSMSIGTPRGEVIIPTVSDDGRLLSDDEAIALFRERGRHLGIFDTPNAATAYARFLHEEEARRSHAGRMLSNPRQGLGRALARPSR